MIMRFITIILLAVFSFAFQVNAQSKTDSNKEKTSTNDLKLNKDKPSVYITFEKYDQFYFERTDQTYDIIWLRVHNNFKGDISFCSYDTSVSPTGKIGLDYIAEKRLDLSDLSTRNNESVPLGMPGFDLCNQYVLKSGESFPFGVHQKDLVKGNQIKIRFFYPWEDAYKAWTGNEPTHYIYYYAFYLPEKSK